MTMRSVSVEVNGSTYERDVASRLLLSDFLRHDLQMTGTHVSCEHGVCGACTIQLDGEAVRSCLIFAVQVGGASIRTVEGMSSNATSLHPLQEAFRQTHGLQCGFCTPGFLMSIEPMLDELAKMNEQEIRASLSGNVCRCTGYQGIVDAVVTYLHENTNGA
ncbi:MAG: aerobic-type carbon monoxide dehydrogenase small subunit (CoxS/CutS family) [Verrucomicrobiales bacterium]|jgi:aerobic-type carbon monoxide dehydrogenase small subunit (CoxS/CutS family)